MLQPRKSPSRALTLIEVLVVLAVLLVLAAVLVPALLKARARSRNICCNCNLKQIGLGFRTWGLDHTDRFPMQVSLTNGGTMEWVVSGIAYPHFIVMSNELGTPKVLVCPADRDRNFATSFRTDFNNSKLSYFVSLDANQANPAVFLSGDRNLTNANASATRVLTLTSNQAVGWTSRIHSRQGNVALADGSVQGFSSTHLQAALRGIGAGTNRLALP